MVKREKCLAQFLISTNFQIPDFHMGQNVYIYFLFYCKEWERILGINIWPSRLLLLLYREMEAQRDWALLDPRTQKPTLRSQEFWLFVHFCTDWIMMPVMIKPYKRRRWALEQLATTRLILCSLCNPNTQKNTFRNPQRKTVSLYTPTVHCTTFLVKTVSTVCVTLFTNIFLNWN